MRALFDYLCGKEPDSDLTRDIAESIARAKKNRKWEREYVQFIEKMMEERNLGRAEGRAEISALTLYLLTQKRYDDLEKASRDESYLEAMLEEMKANQSQMQNSCDSIDQLDICKRDSMTRRVLNKNDTQAGAQVATCC